MPGFFINNRGINIDLCDCENNLYDELSVGSWNISRSTIDKFMQDKAFIRTEQYVIVTEGVLLNKKDLFSKYNCDNVNTLFVSMYSKKSNDLFGELRGSFNGMIYDIQKGVLYVFVDQIGDKPIFYYKDTDGIIVGSTLKYVTDAMSNVSICKRLDEDSARDLLSYSFNTSDHTIVMGVKQLDAGCYIEYNEKSNELSVNHYHGFSQDEELDISVDEAIETIDDLFIKAVVSQYEKDNEYNLKHLNALSGGLDSRMNVWIANECGYRDALDICFSQSDWGDNTYSRQVANYWKQDILFYALDSGNCIRDYKSNTVRLNCGANYLGSAHEMQVIDNLNSNRYGIYHTGQVGDAIIGSDFDKKNLYKGEIIGANSRLILNKANIMHEEPDERISTNELYFLYKRGFKGALCGQIPVTYYTEVLSPFLDTELVDFCLKLPQHYRYGHYIYNRWIMSKHPEAGEIPTVRYFDRNVFEQVEMETSVIKKYEYKMRKIKSTGMIKAFSEYIANKRMWSQVGRKKTYGMNPADRWIEENVDLKEYMDNVFEGLYEKTKDCIPDSTQKYIDMVKKEGVCAERCQAITLMSGIENYIL